MKFCWSTLKVKDMEESLKFYEELVGLKIDRRFNAGPSVEIVFLGDGDTKIELICNQNDKEVNVGTDISWGFEVHSLEDIAKRAEDMGISTSGTPLQPNPHIKFIYIYDPNGLKIQFVENIQ